MGICSNAGVHGQLHHLFAVLDACKKLGHSKVALHMFTDGRDTGPFTGKGLLEQVAVKCRELGIGEIATVCGRYDAMDRDNRWERVEKAYASLTGRRWKECGVKIAATPGHAVQDYYDHPISATQNGDEFVPPTMIGASEAEALSRRIGDGDVAIYYNYRGDRPRELVRAFVLPEFEGKRDGVAGFRKEGV